MGGMWHVPQQNGFNLSLNDHASTYPKPLTNVVQGLVLLKKFAKIEMESNASSYLSLFRGLEVS